MGVLDGKTAIITGAVGGIGGAVAAAFILEGAVVGMIDLPTDALIEEARRLGGHPLPADVGDESSIRAAIGSFLDRNGRLDILFTSAAVQLHGQDASAHELDLDVWERTIRVNLTGTFLTTKYAVRPMLAQQSGSVIHCGSPTGISGAGAGYDAYSASKGGVHALVKSTAIAYAPLGVRVNAIIPGATRTPLIADLLDDAQWEIQLTKSTPLGRLGEPEDVVGLAVLLASDAGSFITGALLCADGGMTAR